MKHKLYNDQLTNDRFKDYNLKANPEDLSIQITDADATLFPVHIL